MNVVDKVNIQWSNLNVNIENQIFSIRKCGYRTESLNILHDASGEMNSGDLIAVLGPSGAGKTTLIAAISQRLRGHVTGKISINGLPVNRKNMTKLSSFVPQFDATINLLTPREHLYYMGELKMSKNWTNAQKDDRINRIIWRLGLEHVADIRIDRLSGGERKKVNLASDLLTDPPIMFCDEPTTGLDTFSALNVMRTMKNLTENGGMETVNDNDNDEMIDSSGTNEMVPFRGIDDRQIKAAGKAIMCSIHHPTAELFEIFTHVIIMHAGSMAFQGTIVEAQEFFLRHGFVCPNTYNPAEFYIQIISRNIDALKEPIELLQIKRSQLQTVDFKNTITFSTSNVEKISWINQVIVLVKRSGLETKRNLKEIYIDQSIFLMLSLAIAFIYSSGKPQDQSLPQNVQGALYTIIAQIVFRTSYGVQHLFPSVLPILRREVNENIYSLSACYVSKIFCRIPMHFLDAFIIMAAVYIFSGFLNEFWMFVNFLIISTVTAITANAYGCMASSIFDSKRTISEIAPFTDAIFTLMSGQLIRISEFPHLKLISLFFFSNEALSITYWNGITDIDCPANFNGSCYHNGIDVLENYSYNLNYFDIWKDYAGLIILAIIMHSLAFIGIRRLTKKVGFY